MSTKPYQVIADFTDIETGEDVLKGDIFEADAERAEALKAAGVIGKEADPDSQNDLDERLKHLGGGYYELPNGEKIRGKEAAMAALKKDDDGKLGDGGADEGGNSANGGTGNADGSQAAPQG